MEIPFQFSPMAKSAEMVASIPDLLSEILLRLPIKSLLRFKLVSKRWFSLISDPRFCQLFDPFPNPAVGLFLPSSAAVHSGEEHHLHHHEFIPFGSEQYSIECIKDHLPASGVRILHSCNGLMLCCSNNSTVTNDDLEYFLFNPTTNKYSSIIPKPDEISKRIRGMYLAFDPVNSFHYKIVSLLLVGGNQESHFQIKVYSSDTNSWLTQGHPFTTSTAANFDKGVYCNSAIHWMFAAGNDESFYYHVHDHTLKQMPSLPLTYSRQCKRDYYLGESCGHLQFIDMRGPRVKLAVYELRTDYSEWFAKYQVDLSHVVAENPAMASLRGSPMFWCCFVFEVLAVVRGGDDGDSFLVLQIPGKVVRYNIVRKIFQDLMEFEGVVGSSLKYPKAGGFQYIRSLGCVSF